MVFIIVNRNGIDCGESAVHGKFGTVCSHNEETAILFEENECDGCCILVWSVVDQFMFRILY